MVVVARRFRHQAGLMLPDGKELAETVRTNRGTVLLSLLFLAGMAMGAVYARNAGFDVLKELDFLFAGNFKARSSAPSGTVFLASFASSFLFLLLCFLCGLSMWGAFFIPLIPVFRGFGLGLTSGYLYAVYGGKGILFNLVVILPGAFLCCLSILLAAREGMRFSRMVAGHGADSGVNGAKVRLYSLHFGAYLGVAFLSALCDLLFAACFGGLFSF